jgi:hypothetical protein
MLSSTIESKMQRIPTIQTFLRAFMQLKTLSEPPKQSKSNLRRQKLDSSKKKISSSDRYRHTKGRLGV